MLVNVVDNWTNFKHISEVPHNIVSMYRETHSLFEITYGWMLYKGEKWFHLSDFSIISDELLSKYRNLKHWNGIYNCGNKGYLLQVDANEYVIGSFKR